MTEIIPTKPRSLQCWHVGLVIAFLVGIFSLLFHLGDAKSLGSHEGYAIIPAREMLLSGDYIVPRFGEIPRLQKPPLIYWSIIAFAKALGGLDIWSARLPAAVGALLLAALMAVWAKRWYGGVAAIGAVATQLTSVYVLAFGRKAEADMILVLLISAALYLVVEQSPSERRQTSFLRWTGIWACAAVSWLGKFHFGPAMIFAPAIAWIILERRWRSLWGLVNPVGIALFLAAVVIWPTLVLNRLPGAWEIWQSETIGRALGDLGREPIWYYVPRLITWTLPWTVFAILAWPASARAACGKIGYHSLRDAIRGNLPPRPQGRTVQGELTPLSPGRGAGSERRADGLLASITQFSTSLAQYLESLCRILIATGDRRERFLWVWLGVSFAMVTASAGKHPHYILPALPAFSLWTARRFAQLAQQAHEGKRLLNAPLTLLITLLGAGTLAGLWLVRNRLPLGLNFSHVTAVVAPIALSLVAAGWLLFLRYNKSAALITATGWVVAYAAATHWLVPSQDHRIAAYRFGQTIRRQFGGESEIGIHGIDQDAILWYLGEPAFRTESLPQLEARLKTATRVRLITVEGHEPALATLGDVRVLRHIADEPHYDSVELGHYRQLVLVEVNKYTQTIASESSAEGRQ